MKKKRKHRKGLPIFLCAVFIFVLAVWLRRDSVLDWCVDDTLYAAEIQEAAQRHGLPPELVRAVVFRESRFRAKARGKAGEVGLMQILPSGAAAEWAQKQKKPMPTRRDLENVQINLEIGCFYLGRGMRKWQKYKAQTALALCQYNAGERRVQKWKPSDPSEADILPRITIHSTREYVKNILNRYRKYCDMKEVR